MAVWEILAIILVGWILFGLMLVPLIGRRLYMQGRPRPRHKDAL